jgi:FKBP-type peptidyl-prolyl cis-trans isomerase 2
MSQAKTGDTVKVHYTGKLTNGEIFDTSKDREPLQFTLGEKQVIAGFEQGIEGMKIGEVKEVNLSSENAYGPRKEEMIFEIANENIPPEVNPQVGQTLTMSNPEGQQFNVLVHEVGDNSIFLDANHPLAGKDLVFEVELMEIV